jgi:hypothetical protein
MSNLSEGFSEPNDRNKRGRRYYVGQRAVVAFAMGFAVDSYIIRYKLKVTDLRAHQCFQVDYPDVRN